MERLSNLLKVKELVGGVAVNIYPSGLAQQPCAYDGSMLLWLTHERDECIINSVNKKLFPLDS